MPPPGSRICQTAENGINHLVTRSGKRAFTIGLLGLALLLLSTGPLSARSRNPAEKPFVFSTEHVHGYFHDKETGLWPEILKRVYGDRAFDFRVTPFIRGSKLLSRGRIEGFFSVYDQFIPNSFLSKWHIGTDDIALLTLAKDDSYVNRRSLQRMKLLWILGYDYQNYIPEARRYTEVKTRGAGLKMLYAGRADGMLDNPFLARKSLRTLNMPENAFRFRHLKLQELYIAFADTPRGREAAEIFDTHFGELLKEGTIKALYDKSYQGNSLSRFYKYPSETFTQNPTTHQKNENNN